MQFIRLRYFHAYKFSGTRMTQRMVQRTTVRKTLRTSPGTWACRRTWDAAVGQDEDEYCEPPVHNGFAKPSRRWVGHEKRNTWAFVLSQPDPSSSLLLHRRFFFPPPTPRQPAPIESHRVLQLWIPNPEWGLHSPRKDGFALTHPRGTRISELSRHRPF